MLKKPFLLLLLCVACSAARAELTWETTTQEFHRAPEDLHVAVAYNFHNTGAKPLQITRIATSCGCTAAKLEQKEYAPGAAGHVDVDFTFGGRRGDQRKIITVTTDEGRQYLLELRCFIEDALTVKPALVFWRLGEAPAPKTVELAVIGDAKLTVKDVQSPTPDIKATLEAMESPRSYKVTITPADTAQKRSVVLKVLTDFPPDAPKTYTIYARVK